MKGKQRSLVWNFFNLTPDKEYVVCDICQKRYKFFKNTTNLQTHLRRIHPEYLTDPLETPENDELSNHSNIAEAGLDVEKLINLVYLRPSLWDQNDKNRNNKIILDKLWDEVTLELNTTATPEIDFKTLLVSRQLTVDVFPVRKVSGELVRNKWRELRSKFRSTLAYIPKPKAGEESGTAYTILWKYFESLLFLKDQFTSIPPSSRNCKVERPIQEQEEYVDDEDMSSQYLEDIEAREYYLDANSPSSSASNTNKKRRVLNGINSSLLEIQKKKFKDVEENKSQNGHEDDDMSFFLSLLPHINKFTPYEKMSYRMKILQVTQEFMPRNNLSDNNSN